MNMQDYTTPFAINGDRDEFSIDTDPSGNVSLERGWTEPYQLRPEEGGKFIPRRIFNQMMNLVSTDTVTWKTQTFANWIADKGDGTPYSYPKDAIVKYTNGNKYISLSDNNTQIPSVGTNWLIFGNLGKIGNIEQGYEAKDYHLIAFGGEFNRADYPLIWAWLQGKSFLKTESQWQAEATANGGNCGFYSSGNGTTTFRVPNLDKAFLRPDSRTIASYQADMLKSHTHESAKSYIGSIDAGSSNYLLPLGSSVGGIASTGPTGETETSPKNIAVLPLIVAK